MKLSGLIVLLFLSLNSFARDRVCILNETNSEIRWTVYKGSETSTMVNFPNPNRHTYQCEEINDVESVDILVVSSEGTCSAVNVKLNDVIVFKRDKTGIGCRSLRNDPAVKIHTPSHQKFLNSYSLALNHEVPDNIAAFSPLPISKTLQDLHDLEVKVFERGLGLRKQKMSFSIVDLNLWAMNSLILLDEILIVNNEKVRTIDNKLGTSYLKKLTEVKNSLAKILSKNIDSVFTFPEVSPQSDRLLYSLASKNMEKNFSEQLARAFSTEPLIISLNDSYHPLIFIEKLVPDSPYMAAEWSIFENDSLEEWTKGYLRLNYLRPKLSQTLELIVNSSQNHLERNETNSYFSSSLASIAVSYPALENSINKDLKTINDYVSSSRLQKAKILLDSLVVMLEELSQRWTYGQSEVAQKNGVSRISIEEQSFDNALVVMLSVEGEDFDFIPVFDGHQTIKGPLKSSYVFKNSQGTLLSWAEAQEIKGRTLALKSTILNDYTYESRLISNRSYFSSNPVREEFQLSGKPFALLTKAPLVEKENYDLKKLVSIPDTKNVGPYLSAFLEGLLNGDSKKNDLKIKLNVSYDYILESGEVSLPVMLLPMMTLDLSEWRERISSEVQYQLERWKKENNPSPGKFVFEFTLYSKKAGVDVPVLRASRIYFTP